MINVVLSTNPMLNVNNAILLGKAKHSLHQVHNLKDQTSSWTIATELSHTIIRIVIIGWLLGEFNNQPNNTLKANKLPYRRND